MFDAIIKGSNSKKTSTSRTAGEHVATKITHEVSNSAASTSSEYAVRIINRLNGAGDISSGGYPCALGIVQEFDSAVTVNKSLGIECQVQLKDNATLTANPIFEGVISQIAAGASGTIPVFYLANMSAVPNRGNVSARTLQSDDPDAFMIHRGPVYGSYGYDMSGAGGELSSGPGFGYVDGQYYTPPGANNRTALATVTPFIYVVPFHVTQTWTPNRMDVEVSAAAGSGTAILGVYTANNGNPNTLVAQATGTVDLTSATEQNLTLSGATLYPGTYCLVFHASANVTMIAYTSETSNEIYGSNTFDITAGNSNQVYQSTAYTGSLPATFTATGRANTSNVLPLITLRKV